jgi:hypothetical protein
MALNIPGADYSFAGILRAVGGFVGNLTGNADTATKLAATKTIGGTAFDGSANITVVSATGNFAVTGDLSSAKLSTTDLSKITKLVQQRTITDVDATSATPTIAQILGGIIRHTSVTGSGTVTVPTGTDMSAGITGVAVGSTVKWLYYNDGDQTATITAAANHTLVGGTPAVTTGKWIECTSVCTAANTWVTFLTTLM